MFILKYFRQHLIDYNNNQLRMEPQRNFPRNGIKQSNCPINNQINRYRNSLPEVDRSENHFFFKQVHSQGEQIAYVTIGYRVGRIPFQLQDLMAVVVNEIHCYTDAQIKLIVDGDVLWLTSTTGLSTSEIGSVRNNTYQADLNQCLLKTQKILVELLQQCKRQRRREDKKVLQKVQNEICKQINIIFKNPNADD